MIETVVKFLLIGVGIAFVVGILGSVAFNWTLDTSPYLSGLASFLHIIYYVLPINKLSPILIIFIALHAFRIAISIARTILDFTRIGG